MKARQIMTSNPCCCSPDDSARDAAALMRDHDCGSVPVVDAGGCVVGMVTDRDLAVRALADGKGADTRVSQLMTPNAWCCGVEDDVRSLERIMVDKQVRRVPVVDSGGRIVGIVAQADLARAALEGERVSDREVALVVERISEPAREARQRAERRADLEQPF